MRIWPAAAAAAAAAAVLAGGYHVAAEYHVGAPPLPVTCVAPDHVSRWWVPDSQLWRVYGTRPGPVTPGADTVRWLGWTEIGGCGQSLTITAGAR